MQPNMQQIPQPQMMGQNPQIMMANPQQMMPQNQLYQVIQTNSTTNRCEKFSQWLTGSKNIPLMVFLIFMASAAGFIFNLFIDSLTFGPILSFSSLGNILFALFVWLPMAAKIEKNTSTVRYGVLYLINCSILCVLTLNFPLSCNRIWCFVLFETLLIAFSNRNKKMKFFCCKLEGKVVIIITIIYFLIFNWFFFISVGVTFVYTFVYQKFLINKFGISNEKVERIENSCFFNWLKNKLATFITLKEVLEKGQQQPLVQNSHIQNSNNSSFVPVNMYPNYYSGFNPNMQPIQPIPHAEAIENVESNMNNMNQPPQ